MAKKKEEVRTIKYPEFDVQIYTSNKLGPLEIWKAKEILGWQDERDFLIQNTAGLSDEEREKQKEKWKFGDDFLFLDEEKNKVRLLNTGKNRPFDLEHARKFSFVVLNRQWADSRNSKEGESRTCNGESGSVGRTGLVLSARHRLAGLVLAGQIREGPQKKHWLEFWPEEPSLEIVLSVGVDEGPVTVATLDNGKTRTLADVLFSDGAIFEKVLLEGKRYALCKSMMAAVKMLWMRTESSKNSFAPIRTHASDLDFIDRHGWIKDAVKFLDDHNTQGNVEHFLPLGYASAFLYLMATSATEPEKYFSARQNGIASQRYVKWANRNQAIDFWKAIASGSSEMATLKEFRRPNHEGKIDKGDSYSLVFGGEKGKGGFDERAAVLIKAWHLFLAGEKITQSSLRLRYAPDLEAQTVDLNEFPSLGGIDFASQEKEDQEQRVSPEELEERKKEARKESLERKKETGRKEGKKDKEEKHESDFDRAARIAKERSEQDRLAREAESSGGGGDPLMEEEEDGSEEDSEEPTFTASV